MPIRLSLRAWWKSLLIVGATAVIATLLINATKPDSNLEQIVVLFGGIVGVLASIVGGWGLLDSRILRKRFLIAQVRNQVPEEARSAISQLNAEGYLQNGSLRGADFSGARLAGVDLKATDKKGAHIAANLEYVILKQVDLSNADLRGINLKGANLDMANLENAKLMKANLTDASIVLTNLKGVSLSEATLTGAKFAGEICDEHTRLPNGQKWVANVDWSEFGAQNELPIDSEINKYREIKHDLIEEKRQADLKLLGRLWKAINTENVIQLDDKTQYRILPENHWRIFTTYLYDRRHYPELHFLNTDTEAKFKKFDNTLGGFLEQLLNSASLEDWHGERIFKPHYKTARGAGYEVIREKEQEWNLTVDLLLEVVREHASLVTYLRHQFPSFDFGTETSITE